MDYEKFGIIATVVILAVVISVSGIAQNIDINYTQFNPNGAQTKSITDIKNENVEKNSEALKNYCEQLDIKC